MNTSLIEAAFNRIKDSVRNTPVVHSIALSALAGCEVYLKLENLQMTGAFKERGALNKLLELSPEEIAKGVVTASAGNHAQGVAYGAQRMGIHSTIIMPKGTPLIKVQSTKSYGAEVVLEGANYDEAYAHAISFAKESGRPFIHPFDDPSVIAGQGTIAVELTQDALFQKIDTVICAVGGGGLISGVATYLAEKRPDVEVIGAEAENCPAMKRSLEAGKIVELDEAVTLADGIAVKRVGTHTFDSCRQNVKQILVADDNEIANAILHLLEIEKILSEGAGAVGLAGLLRHKEQFKGKSVLIVICGGNIDVNKLNRIIVRGLSVDGRICRIRIRLKDVPGSLTRISEFFTNEESNILDLTHHRVDSPAPFGFVDVSVTFETKGHDHIAQIKNSLSAQGYVISQG